MRYQCNIKSIYHHWKILPFFLGVWLAFLSLLWFLTCYQNTTGWSAHPLANNYLCIKNEESKKRKKKWLSKFHRVLFYYFFGWSNGNASFYCYLFLFLISRRWISKRWRHHIFCHSIRNCNGRPADHTHTHTHTYFHLYWTCVHHIFRLPFISLFVQEMKTIKNISQFKTIICFYWQNSI